MFCLATSNGEVLIPASVVQKSATIQNLIQDVDRQDLVIPYNWPLDQPDLSFGLLLETNVEVTDLGILIQTFKLASFLALEDDFIAEKIASVIQADDSYLSKLVPNSYMNKAYSYLKSYFVKSEEIQRPNILINLGHWELIKILSFLPWTDQNINKFLGLFFPGQSRQDVFLHLNQTVGNVEQDPELAVRKFVGNTKIYRYKPHTTTRFYQDIKFIKEALKGEQFALYSGATYWLDRTGHLRIHSYDGVNFVVSEEAQVMTFSKIWIAAHETYLQSTNGHLYKTGQNQEHEITVELIILNFQGFHMAEDVKMNTLIFGYFVGQPAGLYKLVRKNLVPVNIPELAGVDVISIVSCGSNRDFVIHCVDQGHKFLICYNPETDRTVIEVTNKIVLNTQYKIHTYLDGVISFGRASINVPEEIRNKIKRIEAICLTFDSYVFILTDDGDLWQCHKNQFEKINPKFGNVSITDISTWMDCLFLTTI